MNFAKPFSLLLMLLLLGVARADLTIEITKGVEGSLPIAIVPFAFTGQQGAPATWAA